MNQDFDDGIWQHALGGLLLGILIFLMYAFHAIDVWPITLMLSLAFPFREWKQHNWNLLRLFTKLSIALEAFPAFFIVWGFDLVGRKIF